MMSEMDDELDRLRRERVGKEVAIRGQQSYYAELLKGSMGQDMKDVLSGKKKIKPPKRHRIRNFFRKIFSIWNSSSTQKR